MGNAHNVISSRMRQSISMYVHKKLKPPSLVYFIIKSCYKKSSLHVSRDLPLDCVWDLRNGARGKFWLRLSRPGRRAANPCLGRAWGRAGERGVTLWGGEGGGGVMGREARGNKGKV